MEEPILVTVYVPTYNKFDVIYNNLKSILEQNYSDIELIVSDDGSCNFPKEEIISFIVNNKKENIKKYQVIANEKNVGTVRHINKILSQAHGKLYIPLSGDDEFYNSDVISKIVDEYERTHFNVLSTSRVAIDNNGKELYYIPHYLNRFFINKRMKTAQQQLNRFVQKRYYDFVSGCIMVVDADFFSRIGCHDERYMLWEDGPFIAHVTNAGYKINTRYDIISIKYKLGGVSTGGGGNYSNLLYNDLRIFKDNRKNYKVNQLTRRFIKYDELSAGKKTKLNRFVEKMKFFDVFLLKQQCSLFNRTSMWVDKIIMTYQLCFFLSSIMKRQKKVPGGSFSSMSADDAQDI